MTNQSVWMSNIVRKKGEGRGKELGFSTMSSFVLLV